jgi:diguanylate cyclase
METTVMGSRATGRVALVGLAVGLVTLAALALGSTISMQRTTAGVRQHQEINDRWSQALQQSQLDRDAIREFLRTGSPQARQRLVVTPGGAAALVWLRQNGTAEDSAAATPVVRAYAEQVDAMRAAADATDPVLATAHAEHADAVAAAITRRLAEVATVRRSETAAYLDATDRNDTRLQYGTAAVLGLDLGLLGLCGLVLRDNQRRVREQAAQSQHDALHDRLTGLANRALLADRIQQGVKEADRYKDRLGLLLIDLDRFKEINDTLGHETGDLLLQKVAGRLQEAVREVDLVARLGGDEFAVLLPRVGSVTNAMMVAGRIHESLSAPVELDGLTIETAGSIGVNLYPSNSTSSDQLLRHAEIAMYAAKRGRVGVMLYEHGIESGKPAQRTVVSELRRAMDQGDLVLHYQPMADAVTGRISAVEALVRWQHPERGLLGPFEFIPAAEEHGLIQPLTQYVLSSALNQCRQWRSSGLELPVSVNVGAECLQNPTFPAKVDELLSRYEIPAHLLTLEITESAMITNPTRASIVMRELGERGMRLSIDDFGTGYSSISFLHKLPVHEMKLDRAFVTTMRTNAGNKAIVRALLDLGRNFHLQVVAEGIEDGETWDELVALGCDIIQGYHLSRPMPAAEVRPWLERHRGRTVGGQRELAPAERVA